MGVFVLDDVLLDTPGQNERQQTVRIIFIVQLND